MAKGITNKTKQTKQKTNDENSVSSGDRELKLQMPYRHRREKTKDILSKGQKKRLVKKARNFKRIEFVNELSTKVNQNQNINKKVILNKEKNEKKFYFENIDNEIDNIIQNDIKKETAKEVPIKQISNSRHRKQKLKTLIDVEQDKIMKVFNNKQFQSNPREAMTNHIFNMQLLEKKKQQMKEFYNKSLSNLSNIKKQN